MATTAHTIYSRYDPADRERLERETGQTGEDVDPAEAWEVEAKLAFKQRLAPPPRFVPAATHPTSSITKPVTSTPGSDVAGWYRSLTGTTHVSTARASPSFATPAESAASVHTPHILETRNKNNWFIMNAIASQPAPLSAVSPSTLADILARDPPPLPHEEQYSPPVWIALGPSNKGFAMLQNSGWSEGEALGQDVVRRPIVWREAVPQDMIVTSGGGASQTPLLVKEEISEAPISVTKFRQEDIIDLTMSDSEYDESDAEDAGDVDLGHNLAPHRTTSTTLAEGSSRKALITPIATVLKSDRLGIGLKAKRVGPYKASQKRITHNAAAMLAHVRAAEEQRKQKRKTGRGHRGFARQRKAEEANRNRLLAYMNE
ncbi:hypothetical protein C8J57DRAFT_511022 [Mycena rebaudengoi]|nr:hypothetical protein C8J57DRAFT_511022 [Mycena rebaudengoi]